ncbi:MAG: TauD/TfdA family dioxygenase, partial [Blastocatellia bacterium]|nr:TauD/TfdA family dioxygenase [Blastocatellia bacterium]
MTNPLLIPPPEIQGPSAWYGPEMLTRRDWIEQLSENEIAEVERATKPLADAQADITAIRRD